MINIRIGNIGNFGKNLIDRLKRTWSKIPRKSVAEYYKIFHTSPRLDAVRQIATMIADTDYYICKKLDYKKNKNLAKKIDNHAFNYLAENPVPNYPEMDWYYLLFCTAVYIELVGEVLWIKARAENSRKVIGLYICPAIWVLQTPTKSEPYFLISTYGVTGAEPLKIAPDDVVWFKQPDIEDPYSRGRGKTEAIADEIEADEYAAKWQKNFFYNDATPPVVIEAPGATPEEIQAIQDSWISKIGGWINTRKPGVVPWADAKIHQIATSPKELDFNESRKIFRDFANEHWNIPPELRGIVENSNRATIDSAYYLMSKNVITPRLKMISRVITRQLIMPDFGYDELFVFENIIPEDEAFLLQKVNEGISRGTIKRSEWRRAMGFPVTEKDEVYVMPLGLIEVGEKEEVFDIIDDEDGLTIEDEEGKTAQKKTGLSQEQKRKHWENFVNKDDRTRNSYETVIKKISDTQLRMLTAEVDKGMADGSSTIDEIFAKAIGEVFGIKSDTALKSQFAPAWLKSMKEGYTLARDVLGTKGLDFSLYNQRFHKWVETEGLKRVSEINATTKNELIKSCRPIISEGTQQGQSIDKIAEGIKEAGEKVYVEFKTTRARLIARTESAATINYGQEETYKIDGVKEKEWLTQMDGSQRPEHDAANGQKVGINEMFDVGGELLPFPGGGASAGNNCNCRCTILPVI